MTDSSRNKRIIAIVLLFAFFFGIGRIYTYMQSRQAGGVKDGYPMNRDVYLLDTYCTLTVYEGGGQEALSAAVDALNAYDDLMNYNTEGSDIYNINHRSGDRVAVSEDTADMLRLMRAFCVETGGVLEPAIRPVTSLWDFKDEKKVPDAAAVADALAKVKSLAWEIEGNEFVAHDPDVRIDAGSTAKGYIADRIKEVMLQNGVTSGIVNLGGNVLCIGHRPDGSDFKIAVRDPENDNGYAYVLELDDISAVTAGAYERFFIEEGVRYHHIIDPSTGYPARTGLESVTVTGPVSGICDALSTSLFIMGEEQGNEFLQRWNREHGAAYTAYYLRER